MCALIFQLPSLFHYVYLDANVGGLLRDPKRLS